MLVDDMRRKIKTAYDGFAWKQRVDKMPNRQVIAIFYRMQEKGIFEQMRKKHIDKFHQIDITEFLEMNKKTG